MYFNKKLISVILGVIVIIFWYREKSKNLFDVFLRCFNSLGESLVFGLVIMFLILLIVFLFGLTVMRIFEVFDDNFFEVVVYIYLNLEKK